MSKQWDGSPLTFNGVPQTQSHHKSGGTIPVHYCKSDSGEDSLLRSSSQLPAVVLLLVVVIVAVAAVVDLIVVEFVIHVYSF